MKSSLLYPILLACTLSSALALDQKDCRCRVQSSRRIIGGGGQSESPWPWHLSLGLKINKESGVSMTEADKIQRHRCGAIIVNEQWALTAADCFYDFKKMAFLKPKAIDLGYNSNDLVEMVDQNKLVDVDQIVFHPDYLKAHARLDRDANLALLKLKTPFEFSDSVQPACLELNHSRKIYPERLVGLGLGFGFTVITSIDLYNGYYYGNNSRYLKEAWLEDQSCVSMTFNHNAGEICLSGLKRMCKGDEGSPLQRHVNGKATVVGLASYFGLRHVFTPPKWWTIEYCIGEVVYTHLSEARFISWIEETVGGQYCH